MQSHSEDRASPGGWGRCGSDRCPGLGMWPQPARSPVESRQGSCTVPPTHPGVGDPHLRGQLWALPWDCGLGRLHPAWPGCLPSCHVLAWLQDRTGKLRGALVLRRDIPTPHTLPCCSSELKLEPGRGAALRRLGQGQGQGWGLCGAALALPAAVPQTWGRGGQATWSH